MFNKPAKRYNRKTAHKPPIIHHKYTNIADIILTNTTCTRLHIYLFLGRSSRTFVKILLTKYVSITHFQMNNTDKNRFAACHKCFTNVKYTKGRSIKIQCTISNF